MDPRRTPSGHYRRDDLDDVDAIEAYERALLSEAAHWTSEGMFDYARIRDARSVMLDHLRRARKEGPLA